MRKLSVISIIAAAAMSLAACAPLATAVGPPDNLVPGVAADKTVLDEQVAISVELAYQAAVLTVSTATKAGLVKGPLAEKLLDADRVAYQAVLAVRAAYDTGNARSYADAATSAHSAIRSVIGLIAGTG
jgi:hypothetical protein